MSTHSALFRFYIKELRRVLKGPGSALTFTVAVVLHAVGHALVALVGSALAISLVAGLTGSSAAHRGLLRFSGTATPAEQASFLSIVGLVVVLVKSAAGAYATYVQVRVAGEVGASLRLQVFDALLGLHRLRHPRQSDQGAEAQASSRAVLALTEGVRAVESGLSQGLLAGARSVAQLVPLAALLAILAPRIAGVAIGALWIFAWGLGKLRGGFRAAAQRAAQDSARLAEASDDSVRHAELWVSYGAEAKAREKVERLGAAVSLGSAGVEARAAALSGANEVMGAAVLAGTMLASKAGWLGGDADGATLLAFATAFFLAYRPLRELGDTRIAFARAQGAYDELVALIARARPAGDAAGARERFDSKERWPLGALELRDLSLVRGKTGPISLRVEPGAIAVIVGPTGIGKTTLLRTLLGFEHVAGGDVLFDGAPLGHAPAGPATRPFAWVPQDAPILADTLSANVALGGASREPGTALASFGADHLVRSLRSVRLGAGGRAVSGGERQWISLARAIATEQPVLLLDEPISGLDAAASRMVLEAIRHLRGTRTVIIVTHRTEPIALADVVLRLSDSGAVCAA